MGIEGELSSANGVSSGTLLGSIVGLATEVAVSRGSEIFVACARGNFMIDEIKVFFLL